VNTRSASTGRGPAPPLAFPRAGRAIPRLLHAYIATAPRWAAAPSLIFVDEAGRVLDRIPLDRISSDATGRPAAVPHFAAARSRPAFRGIVYALWNARRLGYRRVAVHSDDPAAVAQINGDRHVDPETVGAYLQIRALMHLYKSAQIDVGELVMTVLAPAGRAMPALS
jgi:hypothetical protein